MLKLLGQRTDLPNRFIKWHRAVGRIVPSAHPARNDDEAILAKLKNDRRPDGTAELGSLLQHDLSIPLQVIRQQQIHSKVNAQITLNIQPEEASHLRKESHGATSALDACTAASAHCRMWEPDGRMGSRSAELVGCWVGAASIEARKIFSAKPTKSGRRPAIVIWPPDAS
ncbi:hypothetical protein ABLR35_09990 [Pseudomonas aeruginosa]